VRAVIVYESMFGNTRLIAEAIAGGLGAETDARVIGVGDASSGVLEEADLLVVGGPTHVRSMSRPTSRKDAPNHVRKPGSGLVLEPGADTGPGMREWLDCHGDLPIQVAAFDTRVKGPVAITGRASKGISKVLCRRGLKMVAPAESFLVDKGSHLVPGETERARTWGARLATLVERQDAPRT
jgi:hypothetical protein